jgi:holin-like protein
MIGEKTVYRKIIKIIVQVLAIYLISLLGDYIQSLFNLPIPGSIIGLLILFGLLASKILPEKWILDGVNFILATMLIFFVPSMVGIINYPELFSGKGILLIVGLILCTCLVLISSGYIAMKTSKKTIEKEENFTA